MEKSIGTPAFYVSTGARDDGSERVSSRATTAGPWSAEAQHGGPPAALLTRAIERLAPAGTVVGRITIELLGPVPVGDLDVRAEVLRPGRSVQLAGAELVDVERGRVVATARAWLFPATTSGPGSPEVAGHEPSDGVHRDLPPGWLGGYVDTVEWRWISGALSEPGGGVVWMRPPSLFADEPLSPVQRLMACVDSASGVSSALDIREWAFLNTELTVHVLRPPVGEWICLDAVTELSTGAVGVATSRVYDGLGLVARSAQALLVLPR